MKKMVMIACVAMVISCTANAQKKWSFVPQVGVNLSDFQGRDASKGFTTAAGIVAGGEFEWRSSQLFGLSFGGFYSVKGCNMDLIKHQRSGGDDFHFYEGNTFYKRYELKYLSLPIMLNFHVWKGLTVKCGLQYNNLITARLKSRTIAVFNDSPLGQSDQISHAQTDLHGYSTNMIIVGDRAPELSAEKMDNPRWIDTEDSESAKKVFHSGDVTVPIGVSYEYKNLVLDVRYQLSLNRIPRTRTDFFDADANVHNACTSITLGYKLNL